MKLTLINESKQVLADHPDFLKSWSRGLLSDDYVQTFRQMTSDGITGSACCLMVCEIECNGSTFERYSNLSTPSQKKGHFVFTEGSERGVSSPEWLRAILSNGDIHTPSSWNDTLCLTFKQINTLLTTGEVEFTQPTGE